MKPTLCIWVMLLLCTIAKAQHPLLPDDHFSPLSVTTLNGETIQLQGGRHLLLDFISVYCGGCIAALPQLNTLQQQFGNRLKIVIVANEDVATVKAFFKTNKNAAANNLPVVAGNVSLKQLFPHSLVPHEVWIDTALHVAAITAGESVTVENIAAFVEGRLPALPLKQDITGFNYEAPFAQQAELETAMYWQSRFGNAVPGIGHRTGMVTGVNTTRLFAVNISALKLYEIALQNTIGNYKLINAAQTFLDTQYCYEITAPAGTPVNRLKSIMLKELDSYFNGHGAILDTITSCYLLKAIDAVVLPANKTVYEQTNITDWLSYLNGLPDMPILLPGSVELSNAAMQLPQIKKFTGINDLNAALAPAGLTLQPAQKQLPVFVFIPNQKNTAAR